MPSTSPAQHKLMEAAAHTPGGYGGVPESVGKEFVAADRHDDVFQTPPAGTTDHAIAEGIRDGLYASPQKVGDFWLFDLRVTGTGAAWRESLGEWALRDPELWTSDEMVARATSVPVIFGHPNRSGLNSEEYRERSIGNGVLGYRKGDEVWTVAKIFDDDAAVLMQTTHTSTSPGVKPPEGSEAVTLNDGTKILSEGVPLILDHLAVCSQGVWDKGGAPEGIRLDSREVESVTEEEKTALEKERDDATMRADAAEKERDDMKADAARKDAEEKERDDKAKKDAARKDWETKKDSESADEFEKRQDCRMDGESDEDFKERSDANKSRRDASRTEDVDVNRGTSAAFKADQAALVAANAKLRADHEAMAATLAALTAPVTDEEAGARSKAFLRADTAFQMLGEPVPKPYQGESSIAYRHRAANLLRPFSEKWKEYTIHDSLDATAFSVIEDQIYADAMAEARNPKEGSKMPLRVVETVRNGKTYREFFGDANEWTMKFRPPVKQYVTKLNRNPATAGTR